MSSDQRNTEEFCTCGHSEHHHRFPLGACRVEGCDCWAFTSPEDAGKYSVRRDDGPRQTGGQDDAGEKDGLAGERRGAKGSGL